MPTGRVLAADLRRARAVVLVSGTADRSRARPGPARSAGGAGRLRRGGWWRRWRGDGRGLLRLSCRRRRRGAAGRGQDGGLRSSVAPHPMNGRVVAHVGRFSERGQAGNELSRKRRIRRRGGRSTEGRGGRGRGSLMTGGPRDQERRTERREHTNHRCPYHSHVGHLTLGVAFGRAAILSSMPCA